MSRSNPPLLLWAAVAASIAVMVLAARLEQRSTVLIACAAFALGVIFAAYHISRSFTAGSPALARWTALADGTRLTALVYAWGGLAMLALYRLTPLHWQHGWQYGSGMLLIAAALAAYSLRIARMGLQGTSDKTAGRIVALGVLHGLAALAALAWLVLSGKLATHKADWAANDIFMTGGLAVVAISYFAARTDRALRKGVSA